MDYLISDEDGFLMRIVHWKEEAEKICAIREGWSFKAVRRKKTQAIDWNNFEEAPF